MSVRQSEPEPLRTGVWPSLACLGAGLVLIALAFGRPGAAQPVFGLLTAILLVTGVLLSLWGLRVLIRRLFAWPGRWLLPWTNRRYRVHFQREAYIYMLILIVLCLGALMGHANMLLLVFGLMAGPFVLGGQVTLLVLQRLSIARKLPDHAVVGQPFLVRVRLENRKPLLSAWMIVAADQVSNRREDLRPSVLFTRVPPRGERSATYLLEPAERGRYRFGPLRVTCGFPLGLVQRSFALGETQELIVYPRIGHLTPGWRSAFSRGTQASDRACARIGVFDEEFQRLREYRGGDNPRAIHWRTTARRNELMVREYQHHRDPELWLVLDLWQPARPSADDRRRVELAVSFAATICAEQAHDGQNTNLQLFICGIDATPSGHVGYSHPLRSLLEQLALAEAGPTPPLAAAVRDAAQAVEFEARRVIVSTRTTHEELSAALLFAAAGAADAKQSPMNPADHDLAEIFSEFEVVLAEPNALADYLTYDESHRAARV
ncbi:MAG: DUF58 domain-containing protein [Planctomycetaceae bacterium]|nr:DUF58 domain-containing protein [Planctomycetaceae bacterium]